MPAGPQAVRASQTRVYIKKPEVGYPGYVFLINVTTIIWTAINGLSMIPERVKPGNFHTRHRRLLLFTNLLVWSFTLQFTYTVFVFVFLLLWIMKVRGETKPYLNSSEDAWGFGQIMPNILLAISLFSALECYSGE
jgi:hypothetical protein